jgi:hypothetical protein
VNIIRIGGLDKRCSGRTGDKELHCPDLSSIETELPRSRLERLPSVPYAYDGLREGGSGFGLYAVVVFRGVARNEMKRKSIGGAPRIRWGESENHG